MEIKKRINRELACRVGLVVMGISKANWELIISPCPGKKKNRLDKLGKFSNGGHGLKSHALVCVFAISRFVGVGVWTFLLPGDSVVRARRPALLINEEPQDGGTED